jgi:hypothetical protein
MDRWFVLAAIAVVVAIWWLFQSAGRDIPVRPWQAIDVPDAWGVVEDPDGKCLTEWKRGGLALDLPGGVFELQGNGPQNAPRVLRKFSGDFALEAKFTGTWRPKVGKVSTNLPYHGAGLLVWTGESTFLRLERAVIRLPDGEQMTYVHFENHGPDGPRNIANLAIGVDEFPHLAIERQGSNFIAYVDRRRIGAVSVDAPIEIRAGVAAVINTSDPFQFECNDVRFFKVGGGP